MAAKDVLTAATNAVGITAPEVTPANTGRSPSGHSSVAADFDHSGPADIAPAMAFSTSGAPVQVVPDVDPSHPAVDNDPRAGTTLNMNRIDFNNPVKPGHEVVEAALKDQADA